MNASAYTSLHVLQSLTVTVTEEGSRGGGTASDVTYCIVQYLYDFPTPCPTVILTALSFTTVQYTVYTVVLIPPFMKYSLSCFMLCSAHCREEQKKWNWKGDMWRSPRYRTVRPYGTDGKWVVRPFLITLSVKIRFLPYSVPSNSDGPFIHPCMHPYTSSPSPSLSESESSTATHAALYSTKNSDEATEGIKEEKMRYDKIW